MTQESLAERVGIHWKTLGYIESGKRDFGVSILARIASILPGLAEQMFKGIKIDSKNERIVEKATKRKRKGQGSDVSAS